MIAVLACIAHAFGAPMTLADAIVRAESTSLEIRLQQLSVDRASRLSDPGADNPSLRVSVRDLGEPLDPPRVVAALRLPLPRPWDVAIAIREARSSATREDAELERRRADLRADVRSRFHQVLLLRQVVEHARQLVEIRRVHLEMVVERRGEGMSTVLDWLDSEEDRRAADAEFARWVEGLTEAEAGLRSLCDLPPTELLELAPDDPLPAIEAELQGREAMLVDLLDRSPDVREAEARIVRDQARLTRSRLRALPAIDWIQGSIERTYDVGGAPMDPIDRPPVTYRIGAAVELPLYQWGPRRTRAEVLAVESARVELQDTQRATTDRVVRRLRDLDAAKHRHAVAQAHRQALATESESVIDVVDALIGVELQARNTGAALRETIAVADLVLQFDQLVAEASLIGADGATVVPPPLDGF